MIFFTTSYVIGACAPSDSNRTHRLYMTSEILIISSKYSHSFHK
uniref:Uncharacterized protein n=1 Tax=Lepeophtheirus salmonis TaxID=72036 RepID=A0A0K2UP22_LEPSM